MKIRPTFKGALGGYVVLTLLVIIFMLGLIKSEPLHSIRDWLALAVVLIVPVFLYLEMGLAQVFWFEDGMLFYKKRIRNCQISILDIQKACLDMSTDRKKNGLYTLVLALKDNQTLEINLKPFERKQIQFLIARLKEENPVIEFDGYCRNLLKGKMGDIIKEGVGKASAIVVAMQLVVPLLFLGIVIVKNVL